MPGRIDPGSGCCRAGVAYRLRNRPGSDQENGAVVPVTIATSLAGARSISIIVEGNPNPLSASFTLLEGTNPEISTRIKMGESSDVVAAVVAALGFAGWEIHRHSATNSGSGGHGHTHGSGGHGHAHGSGGGHAHHGHWVA